MPYTTLALTLLSLTLIGVPLTNGFVSKCYMMEAIIESHTWISLVVFAAGSFLALIYMWRMVEKMYFENDAASCAGSQANEVPLLMLICLLFMTILTVVTGIYSNPVRLVIDKFAF